MGNTKRQKRVASFDKGLSVDGRRLYKPVNKRAKAYAKAIKAKRGLSVAQLKTIKVLGKHKVVVYDNPLSNHFTTARV